MSLDEYSSNIKNAIERLHLMFPNLGNDQDDIIIQSILKQLHFILYHIESKTSFKAGLIEKNKQIYGEMFEYYPIDDKELKDAIDTIYSDLIDNDYNVGQISQKQSETLFNLIQEKHIHYNNLFLSDSSDKFLYNCSIISNHFWGELYATNYYDLWIKNGIKNIQYFFLISSFNYFFKVSYFEYKLHPDAKKLYHDIIKIQNFYTGKDAESTCMDLQPLIKKEINGKIHLVDLYDRIVA